MQIIKGVASSKPSFREHCATMLLEAKSTKYKCLEHFALYGIINPRCMGGHGHGTSLHMRTITATWIPICFRKRLNNMQASLLVIL